MCPLLSRGLWLPPPHEPQALALAISLDSEQLRVLGLADLGGGQEGQDRTDLGVSL